MAPDLQAFAARNEDVRLLCEQIQSDQLVHAYLISGEPGYGKRTLAGLIAAALLCSSEGGRPCGQCKNCRMALRLEHPDLTVIRNGVPITPDGKKDRATIPVDDIREMIRICGEGTLMGNVRAVLVFDAEKMTIQAQNCLLKTLEEPPERTYIFLVTDHPDALLTTVISRCRPIRLRAWEDEYIVDVLKDLGIAPERAAEAVQCASGSIGKAISISSDESYWTVRKEVMNAFFESKARSDILRNSNAWKDRRDDGGRILDILESLLHMLIRVRMGQASDVILAGFPDNWRKFARHADYERISALSESIAEARKQLTYSVNFQAVIEQIMFLFAGEGNLW